MPQLALLDVAAPSDEQALALAALAGDFEEARMCRSVLQTAATLHAAVDTTGRLPPDQCYVLIDGKPHCGRCTVTSASGTPLREGSTRRLLYSSFLGSRL